MAALGTFLACVRRVRGRIGRSRPHRLAPLAGPTLDLTLRFGHRPEFDRLGRELRTGALTLDVLDDMRAGREPGQLSTITKTGEILKKVRILALVCEFPSELSSRCSASLSVEPPPTLGSRHCSCRTAPDLELGARLRRSRQFSLLLKQIVNTDSVDPYMSAQTGYQPYEDELPVTAKADADGMRSAAARPITEIVLNIGLLLLRCTKTAAPLSKRTANPSRYYAIERRSNRQNDMASRQVPKAAPCASITRIEWTAPSVHCGSKRCRPLPSAISHPTSRRHRLPNDRRNLPTRLAFVELCRYEGGKR